MGDWGWNGVDVTVPSPARIYDYLLGGKDNFAVDRASAEKLLEVFPDVRKVAAANRAFLGRAVRFVAERGVRQFIDLGAGLPTQGHVHEVARKVVAEDVRVVYVDNDPIAAVHARALLEHGNGVRVVEADIRDPQAVLSDPGVTELIDFSRPFALLAVAVLHFIPEEDDPYATVRAFTERMVPGSHLVISHGAIADPQNVDERVEAAYKGSQASTAGRTPEQIRRFFTGLELADPGELVDVREWHPGLNAASVDGSAIRLLAGVGHLPDEAS